MNLNLFLLPVLSPVLEPGHQRFPSLWPMVQVSQGTINDFMVHWLENILYEPEILIWRVDFHWFAWIEKLIGSSWRKPWKSKPTMHCKLLLDYLVENQHNQTGNGAQATNVKLQARREHPEWRETIVQRLCEALKTLNYMCRRCTIGNDGKPWLMRTDRPERTLE